ncbi:alkylation response protein AidB-like acyl-CoA dehydrogenase [Kribbella sp. VKM Ac-2527]|uniref:Alkylation response protein AidB-like acyl-CoA dehydrogenase n=1 Tax=Kribbella caucasensis TaxID=2512215 RepID=A0A4R6J8F4_9ACTN|nr:acyl-CoA dehydrogenase family protein [Kribbella sp. VKM Ac-2527]TDO30635.1 alkylation response protein AidB-like acyl-CoA dehydrogenase [Kribbella sp. VKM Ac-2527]
MTAAPELHVTVTGIRAGIAPILERLAATAGDREATRDYPYEEVRALAEHRITLTGIAVDDGGAGGTLRDVVDLVIAIARADSNVAQALRSSFRTAASVIARQDLPHRERTLARLRNGDLFAGTSNERGGAAGAVATRLLRKDDGEVLSGAKYYSTGGLFAQWFSGTATDEDGKIVRFTVPTDREGVERLDDFDAIGQRLTASGTTRLNDVRVYPDEVIRADEAPPRNPWQGSFAQLYLASIEAGIAGAAFDDAVRFAREKARPIKHSTADGAVDDPYVRHVVGEIAARANAARAVVLLAAEELGAVPAASDDEVRAAGARAALTVAQAQYIAVESALRAAELAFDVGGGSATDRGTALDRHWRNARTVANHNPRNWKAAVVGGFHLTGDEPPTSGLF